MIVDNVWKLTNTCHGVSHCENWTTFLKKKTVLSLVQKWWRGMTKRIRERVTKAKKGRTVSDDPGGKYLSDTSTSVGVKSTVIRTSVNTFETSKSKRGISLNTVLIRCRTNDGIKTIILSSSSGVVAFLTPNTTRGSLLVICQVENTWSDNLTSSGRNGCWGQPFQEGSWRLWHYWTVYNFINDCHDCCETDGGW